MTRIAAVEIRDKRDTFVVEGLARAGMRVVAWEDVGQIDEAAEGVVRSVLSDATVEDAKSLPVGAWLFGRGVSEEVRERLQEKKIKYFDIFDDETFAFKNAYLTAEGALAYVILRTEESLRRLPVLVFGYGRVGKSVTKCLKDNHCLVSVATDDAGVSVVVYPEARYSLDGRQGRVSDSIYKLIKWLKVPVVTLKCNMSYQVRPRYVNDFRKGRVIVETAVALSAEECAALTSDEIKARLQPWLTYNDLAYQEQAKQCFKGKKGYAEGLPDLLYKCPKCGAEFAHKARGNYMECAVCGNTVEIDGYNVIRPVGKGSVCPSRIDYWYDYQYNELKKEIISNEDYSLAHKVKMSVSSDKDCCYTEVESGVLNLTKNGLVYQGTEYPEVRFRIPNPPALSIDLIDRIDVFADDDTIFRFLFTAPEKPIKLNIALEIIADNISD